MTSLTTESAPGATPARPAAQLKRLARLSLSLGFVQVGFQLPGFVDTVLAGRVGGETLAATGMGSAIFFAVSVLGIGTMMGLDPLVAQAFGAGRRRRARRLLWQGLYAGGIVTLPLSLGVLGFGTLLERVGVAPELAEQTRAYLIGRIGSLWPMLACVALRAYLQSTHRTRPIMVGVVALNLINLAAAWLLLFGDDGLTQLGLPALGLRSFGVMGLAWGASLATVAQLVVMALAARSAPMGEGDEPVRALDRKALGLVFTVGGPLGLQMVAEVGVFALVGVMMGSIGTRAAGAHQVALQLASLSFAACLGIGAATSVEVGRAIGAGDALATRRAGLSGIALGATFMLGVATLMWTAPEALAGLMTTDREVIPMAAKLLMIAAVFQVVDGIQAVSGGALRGAGATGFIFGAHLIGHWLVGFPLGIWLGFGLAWGPAGLWWGLTAGLAVAAVAVATKFVVLSRHLVQPIQ